MNENIDAIIYFLKNIFKRSNRIYKHATNEHFFLHKSDLYFFNRHRN